MDDARQLANELILTPEQCVTLAAKLGPQHPLDTAFARLIRQHAEVIEAIDAGASGAITIRAATHLNDRTVKRILNNLRAWDIATWRPGHGLVIVGTPIDDEDDEPMPQIGPRI